MKKKEFTLWVATLFFALFAMCPIEADAQRISVRIEQGTLDKAFQEIISESKVQLVYNTTVAKGINVKAQDFKQQDITRILDVLLAGTPLTYQLDNGIYTIINRTKKELQQKSGTVRGRVLHENGEPIIGASIVLKGSTRGTITDADGKFQLPEVKGDVITLRVSYIGMLTKEENVKLNSNTTFYMQEDASMLSEVVVTGYQTISRERVTGSFDKVGNEMLSNRPTADISSALQGLVAGMQATEKEDGSVDFLIRGTSSLYANTAPLIVVDGFPIEGTFNSINPNDVESITVLKDASAASIWGARSANGVIVVTTKRGKQNSKLNVNVQSFWRIGTNPDLDYILAQADSRTTVDYEIKALENGWNMGEYVPGFSSLGSPLSLAMELWYANKYKGLTASEMNAGLEKLRNTNNRNQLKDYLMQTPLLQQYNVSISGSTEKFDNYVSLMYEKNDEATIKRGYERFMVNYNGTYRFNRRVTGSVGTTWQKRQQETSGVRVSDFTELSPYEMLKNDDGSYAYNVGRFNRFEVEDLNTEVFPYQDFSYNMLREVENRSYKTDATNMRIQLGLNVELIKGLTYDLKYQYEQNSSEYRNLEGEETLANRYLVNLYTMYDSYAGELYNSYLPTGTIVRTGKNENRNTVLRNQLTYNNTFGKHDITALAGTEISEYFTKSVINPTAYGYNEKTNTAQDPYYGSYEYVENLFNDWNIYAIPEIGYTFNDRKDRYLSYFFNAGYTYDEKYGLSYSTRYDGSNFVSKDKSLRWSPMWSVGGKWNITKEKFMQEVDWVDYLTLRATYGSNGNAEKSTSPQTLISVTSSSVTYGNVGRVTSLGNPNLRWETTYTANVGIDFTLFKNILSGKLDVYNRRSKDVIGEVAVPTAYGTNLQRFNNAEISNKGFELELTGRFNVKPIGLGITSTATLAYNKNRVEKLYNANLRSFQLAEGIFVEGDPIGTIYSYEFAGTEDGMPYVYGLDGKKVPFGDYAFSASYGKDAMICSGTTIAPYTLGWANQFSWKGFSLYVFLTGKFGGIFRAPVPSTPPLVGETKQFISKYISFFEESDGTLYPTYPNPNDISLFNWQSYMPYLSCFVESADHVRLKEISLSYQLPLSLLRKVNIKQAKVFCQARDLGVIWAANQYNYDPEWLPSSNKPAASVTLGLNVNF